MSLCSRRLGMAMCQSEQPTPDSTFCSRFIESVRMMACAISASSWEASHRFACVTVSASLVRPEVVTLWAPLPPCIILTTCLTMNSQLDRSFVTEPFVQITISCGLLLASTRFVHPHWFFPAGHSLQCVPRFCGRRVLQ